MESQNAGQRNLQDEIEYSIIALGLSAMEIDSIIKEAAGVTVDSAADNGLQDLDASQLESIWKRLSEHSRWTRRH